MILKRLFILAAAMAGLLSAAPQRPNVLIIIGDDCTHSDLPFHGGENARTPHLSALAKQGMVFDRAYLSMAMCAPSRSELYTGRLPLRNGCAWNHAPSREGTRSITHHLGELGYRVGLAGKSHVRPASVYPFEKVPGFDENCVREPTLPHDLKGVKEFSGRDASQPFCLVVALTEPHVPWVMGDENIADDLTSKAVAFIEQRKDQPFFLFLATHDAHVPRTPHPRFAGKTGLGPRGDAIAEFDWTVGEVAGALDRLRLAEDTLFIISSDNGPVLDDGYQDDAVTKNGDHTPAGPWRGGKSSAFEAGTRVPFIVRWPARVKPGVSESLIGQIDLLSSLASLTDQKLAAGDAPDSVNLLPALLGESRDGRDHLIRQGASVSIIRGGWKYIEPVKNPKPVKIAVNTNTETGRDNVPQLYDLAKDPGERKNIAAEHPEKVAELSTLLEEVRKAGATPGR